MNTRETDEETGPAADLPQLEEAILEDAKEKEIQSAWGEMDKDNALDYYENRIRSYYQRSPDRPLRTDLQEYSQELNQLTTSPHEEVHERLAFLQVLYQFTLDKTLTPDLLEWLQYSTENDEPAASSIKATLKIMELAQLSRQPEADMEEIAHRQEEIKDLLTIMRATNGMLLLDNMDLSYIQLESSNLLEGMDLSATSFSNSSLHHARLSGCILREADFQQADLTCALLMHTDLSLAKMQHTICVSADFSAATAQLITTNQTDFTQSNFSHANLRGIHFDKCNIDGARFNHAVVTFSVFTAEQQALLRGRAALSSPHDINELLKKEEQFLKKVLTLVKRIDTFMYPHTDIEEDPHKRFPAYKNWRGSADSEFISI